MTLVIGIASTGRTRALCSWAGKEVKPLVASGVLLLSGAFQFVAFRISQGLLPVVTAISKDIMGRKLLVTRKVAARDDDKGDRIAVLMRR
jgi:hypothetical protein